MGEFLGACYILELNQDETNNLNIFRMSNSIETVQKRSFDYKKLRTRWSH